MPDPLELEGKFSCSPADLERVVGLRQIGEFQLTRRNERVQTDVYFDTPSLLLRKVSCSLRLREIGSSARATFKGPRESIASARDELHLVQRVEIEIPVEPPPTSHQDFISRVELEPVRRAYELINGGGELLAIAQLVTHRRTLHYERQRGEVVEVSVDNVRALDLRNNHPTRIVEIELELIEGSEEAFVAAASALRETVPTLQPSVDSKLARTLGQFSQPPDSSA